MGSNSTEMVAMVPWLHVAGGDILFFQSLRPTSKAAVVGASIALLLLALLDRWISAYRRGSLEAHWRHRALVMAASHSHRDRVSSASSLHKDDDNAPQTTHHSLPLQPPIRLRPKGSINVPFILKHDLLRGIVHAAQALLGYIFMLAAMTFQAAYIISIILGLGIGETLFGRMGGGRSH